MAINANTYASLERFFTSVDATQLLILLFDRCYEKQKRAQTAQKKKKNAFTLLTPSLFTASVKPCTYGTNSFMYCDISPVCSLARKAEDAEVPFASAARRAESPDKPTNTQQEESPYLGTYSIYSRAKQIIATRTRRRNRP